MCTYVLMKVLESAPSRYDRGIQFLTLGRINKSYDRLVENIRDGFEVLDIGCGTGALSLRAAYKGAMVKGIDINPAMLEIASKRIKEAKFDNNVNLVEMSVVELDEEPPEHYDAIMSGLCFSELTDDEIHYTLKEIKRILKPGGLLLLADEVKAKGVIRRGINWIVRLPLLIITYILTQTTTKVVSNFEEKILMHFDIKSTNYNALRNFVEIVAYKQEQ